MGKKNGAGEVVSFVPWSFELESIRPDELRVRMLLCVNCVFSAPGSPFSSPLRVHIFRSVQPCKVRSFSITYFFFPTPILYLLFIFVIVVLLCCFCWLCIWQAYGIMSSAMGCCWIWSRIRNGLQNTFFGPIIEDNVLTLDAGWQYEILDLETSTYPT